MTTTTTTRLDAVLEALIAAHPQRRWTLEGWANHLRGTRHPVHTANCYAKHKLDDELADSLPQALVLTTARMLDQGLDAGEAHQTLNDRIIARREKDA